MFPVVLLALAFGTTAFAADCFQNEQRTSDTPTGDQIGKVLTADLGDICATTWRTDDDQKLQITYNHWMMLLSIQRTDNTKPLQHCQSAFNEIISQCIQNGNTWGGASSLDGESYNITNSGYPENGLSPYDDGGAPLSVASSTTAAPTTISTPAITPGPEIIIQPGTFATTTASIEGLTAHSATSTSADGLPTILPIWFVSAGIGIIVIPVAGVVPGGIIPPPPGYPPLIIDSNGNPQIVESDDLPSPTPATTTPSHPSSSSSTSCSACATCVGFEVLPSSATEPLENDGDIDLPDIDPALWSSLAILYPSPAPSPEPSLVPSPVPSSVPSLPIQSASPIDKPACVDASEDVKSDLRSLTFPESIRTSDGRDNNVEHLLYRLREVVCGGSCAVPKGINSKYVAVYQNGGECEIAIGLSDTTEIYLYRSMWVGDGPDASTIWQQCWDSTHNIIQKCVKSSAKSGWWNGNHVYQFYQGGVRALNDASAKHMTAQAPIGSWLQPPTEGLSCDRDCCGMVLNGDWCNQNCGGPTCRRGRRSEHFALRPRATQSVAKVGGCAISYVLPDYPSSGKASGIPEVVKWYDRDDSAKGDNNCDNPVIKLFRNRQSGHEYDTEHVYEKHLVKRFIYYLIGGEQAFDENADPDEPPSGPKALPITDCVTLQKVFGSLSTAASSSFGKETAAAQLGKAVSCSGTACPATDRLSEFFLLRHEINGMKNRIVSGHYTGIGADGNDNKLPKCNPATQSAAEMQQQMINAALVVQYLREQAVFNSFNTVNNRMKSILNALDTDPLGSQNPPQNLRRFISDDRPISWESAYDEFMARLLQDTERKMSKWLFDCKKNYAMRPDKKNKVAGYAGTKNNPQELDVAPGAITGVYAETAMSWGGLYDGIRRGPSQLE